MLAAIKLEKIYRKVMEIIDAKMPNVNAWLRVNFPVGIGRRQVLFINESRSDSYHIFNAPAAPEPKATAAKEKTASTKLIFTGAINKPTAQVKITKDITRGFIKLKKAFMLLK